MFSGKLAPADVKMSYYSAARKIVLSSGSNQTSVDCDDFIKDGMLSSAQLCGTVLVLKFNTDAGSQPISVQLSSFVDNYDGKITQLSNNLTAIDAVQGVVSCDGNGNFAAAPAAVYRIWS